MNPNVGENQRPIEAAPTPSKSEQVPDEVAEKGLIASPETSPQTQSVAASSQAATDMALPSQTIATGLAGDEPVSVSPAATTVPADDTDRIEKQWIDKAKTVAARTKDDPYEQKNEMSKVKSEYIEKRFNKTLKSDDAVAK